MFGQEPTQLLLQWGFLVREQNIGYRNRSVPIFIHFIDRTFVKNTHAYLGLGLNNTTLENIQEPV
jgi:hypothetical protein